MVHSLTIQLVAFSYTHPVGTLLFDLLNLNSADGYPTRNPSLWPSQNVSIHFATVRLSDFRGTTEGHEEFMAAFDRELLRIAAWLDGRPPGAFEECRRASLEIHLQIDAEIDEDDFELILSPRFLVACGQAGLPIRIDTGSLEEPV